MPFLARLLREPLHKFFIIGGATFAVDVATAAAKQLPAEMIVIRPKRGVTSQPSWA
jgi:hypothetical protein